MNWSYVVFWGAGGFAGLVAGVFILRARHVLTSATFGALVVAWVGFAVGAKWQEHLGYLPVLAALWTAPQELFGSGGFRLSLGLVTGGVVAGAWCLLFRAPWRETGDALAVAASVLIPIGRLACLASGCCMGTACGRFTLFCLRYPVGSEAFGWQLTHNLVSSDAPLSLPAHPLPLYFAAASLLTLGVLLWLLRRGAPPGSLLATFCILRPAAKLALEPLRAVPPSGAVATLMMAIPATVLGLTCVVLGAMLVRRRLGGGHVPVPVPGNPALKPGAQICEKTPMPPIAARFARPGGSDLPGRRN